MIEINIKKCPCCSGTAKLEYRSGSWGYYPAKHSIKCTACGLQTAWIDEEETLSRNFTDDAVIKVLALWNARAKPEGQGELF